MGAPAEFDAWAEAGRDRGMEERHWHTARHALARVPVEDGDVVLDVGCGSGYAARALRSAGGAARAYGVDAAPRMARNARSYADDPAVGFLVGGFEHLPFPDGAVDHAFSMEAIYYAADVETALREGRRVLRSGGTFHCAVNYYEESEQTRGWPENVGVEMARLSMAEYRAAFRRAGFHVASQDEIPDREVEIPPAGEFPHDGFESRAAMVERYREHGTLLTVGVVP
jgi:ubiquinone/menaquinone biosynthesis C-methylase UbiE